MNGSDRGYLWPEPKVRAINKRSEAFFITARGYPGIILLVCSSSWALRHLEPPAPARVSRNEPVEGWVDVRLNHFDASNTDTFRMRYFYNDEFADGGNNIVIYVGGEWEINAAWTQGGLSYQLAEATGAALFYTEHRYYGNTRPTVDTSVENLRYLSVDQALGDLAQFIQHVKSDSFENGRYRNASVGLAGCSYAGSMVTWMKLGYPHLIDAAFSDSGPLLAQDDFPEYLEVVTEAIRTQGSEACLTTIEQAVQEIVQQLETSAGRDTISNLFNTCATISSSPLDVATFWSSITTAFSGLVQYAAPGEIPDACAILTNETVADPVQRLANYVTVSPDTQPCTATVYADLVEEYTNTSYDSPKRDIRLWTYQTCVEYGWYQTTTSDNQPFLNTVPLEYNHQMCKDIYSSYFDEQLQSSGIWRTNTLFGGRYVPDGVVSVVGGHDPWSPMGPTETHATDLAPVYLVPTVSHCTAVHSTASSATEELARVKVEVLNFMQYRMTGERSFANKNI